MTTRREIVLGAAALATLPLGASRASAQASVNMATVLAQTHAALPDLVYGPENAKVTVVEYASLTCSHCATFHNTVWPPFKAKYVDTGRVRFIFRNFVLNPLDMAASMLSYCGPADKRGSFIEFMFKQQERWAFTNTPLDSLLGVARQAGFTQESFGACLQRQDLYGALTEMRNKAGDAFRINSTPTLIINGQVHRGALQMPELERIIDPLLA